jgi:hypothetical protein
VVQINTWEDATRTIKALQSKPHPFKSLSVDSISELQNKCIESIAGLNQVKLQDWGTALRLMRSFCNEVRDLTKHPNHPFASVVVTSMSKLNDDTKVWEPYLQGQMKAVLPYLFDVNAFLIKREVNRGGWVTIRELYTEPSNNANVKFTAGSRISGRVPVPLEGQHHGAATDPSGVLYELGLHAQARTNTGHNRASGDSHRARSSEVMASEDSDFDFAGELANMDDIQTGSQLLPEGEYNWVVKSASTGTSSNQNPYIALQLEILDGPYRGKTVPHSIYYSTQKQSGIEFFWRQMSALGISSTYVRESGNTSIRKMADLTVGVQLTAKIKHETYQEVERAKTQLGKIIGTNPNLDNGAAVASVGGAAPAQNTLPAYVDEDAAPAQEPATVGAPAGVPTAVQDDPWGTSDS